MFFLFAAADIHLSGVGKVPLWKSNDLPPPLHPTVGKKERDKNSKEREIKGRQGERENFFK